MVSLAGQNSPTRGVIVGHLSADVPPIYTLLFQQSGCHNRLIYSVPKQLDLAAVRVAGVNTNSHAEVASTGLQ